MVAAASLPSVDVLVVGGGILGLCVAWLAQQEKLHVAVTRLSDRTVPHADTLRNQGWLQSGLRYARDTDHARGFAQKMRRAGQDLHDRLLLPPPTGFGVLRAIDESDAKEFERRAAVLGDPIRRLDDEEASAELGPLFERGGLYLVTRELPFAEARVLTELREQFLSAQPAGIVIEGRAELCPAPSSSTKVIALVDGRPIEADVIVLAAGAGNLPLLKSIQHDVLCLKQTPLLVAQCPEGFQAKLFHDRVRDIAIVKHETNNTTRLVVSAGLRHDTEFVEPPRRRISRALEDKFWKKMPHCLLNQRGNGARITAGMEPCPLDGKEDFEPWLFESSTFTNLVAAMPGRATIGLDAAEDVLEVILQRISLNATTRARAPGFALPAWSDPICMHFEPQYDSGLHDVEA